MSMKAALRQYYRLWQATAAGRCRARTLKKRMMDAAFAGAGPRKLEYCMEPGMGYVPNIKCLLFIVVFVRNGIESCLETVAVCGSCSCLQKLTCMWHGQDRKLSSACRSKLLRLQFRHVAIAHDHLAPVAGTCAACVHDVSLSKCIAAKF